MSKSRFVLHRPADALQVLRQDIDGACRVGQRGGTVRRREIARIQLERSSELDPLHETSLTFPQTSRVWDIGSGETKMELRGHEHVVECAVFAPVIAYPAIRELAGIQVRA